MKPNKYAIGAIATFISMVFVGSANAIDPTATEAGRLYYPPSVAPVYSVPVPLYYVPYAVTPQYYAPVQVPLVPLKYQGTVIEQRRGPIRRAVFGPFRATDVYTFPGSPQ